MIAAGTGVRRDRIGIGHPPPCRRAGDQRFAAGVTGAGVKKARDPRDARFIEAIACADVAAAREALRSGARPVGNSEVARFALRRAIRRSGSTELLELVIEAGADPRAPWRSETFLMVAARYSDRAHARRLVELGVDAMAVDAKQQCTALDVAISCKNRDVAQYLSSLGVPELHAELRRFTATLRRAWRARVAWCTGPVSLINPAPGELKLQCEARLQGHELNLYSLRFRERCLSVRVGTWITVNGDNPPPSTMPSQRAMQRVEAPFEAVDVPAFRCDDAPAESDDALRSTCREIEPHVARLQLHPNERLQIGAGQVRLMASGLDAGQALARLDVLKEIAGMLADRRSPRPPLQRDTVTIKTRRGAPKSRGSHAFGGHPVASTCCPACGVPATPVLRLDLADPLLAGLAALSLRDYTVHWCTDCADWGPLFFDVSGPVPTALREIDSHVSDAADDDGDELPRRDVELVVGAPRSRSASRVGGTPAWIQDDGTPDCPRCHDPMAFVLQLSGTPDIDFCDEGRLYSFACPECRVVASVIQSH